LLCFFGTRLLITLHQTSAQAPSHIERTTTTMRADHLVHGEIAEPQPSPFLLAPFGRAAEPVAAMMRADRSLFADLFAIDQCI
jgi:hypothetical protein